MISNGLDLQPFPAWEEGAQAGGSSPHKTMTAASSPSNEGSSGAPSPSATQAVGSGSRATTSPLASVSKDDDEGHDAVNTPYASLARAIKYLFIYRSTSLSSPRVADAAGSSLSLSQLPVGEALSTHTLFKLFLLCGIKRHHCQRFVDDILAQLLELCFPNVERSMAATIASAHLGSAFPQESRSPQRPGHAVTAGKPVGRSRKVAAGVTSSQGASAQQSTPMVVRHLWVDAQSWEISRVTPVTVETLLLSLLDNQTRAALFPSLTSGDASSVTVQRGMNSGFVLCVTEDALERLISRLFIEELRGQMMTVNPLPRWRMACRLLNAGEAPIIIFCGGTSGSGKSTLASLLAAQLSINQVLSTDTVRQLLRARVKREDAPELFVSTYEAFKAAHKSSDRVNVSGNTGQPSANEVIAAYERQATLVLEALDKTLDNLIARGQSVVVEGVHLLPEYMARKHSEFWGRRVICTSVLVQIRKEARHRERFAVRAKCMTLDPKGNKYVSHFAQIRTIQSYLSTQASQLPILAINNTNVDKSFMLVHYALLQLIEHVGMEGWPSSDKEAVPLRVPVNVNAKKMLLYLQEHRKEKGEKAGPHRGRAARSFCTRHQQSDAQLGTTGNGSYPSYTCDPSPLEGLCAYCRVILPLATSIVTRAHSAELLTAPQRRQFDAPPRHRQQCEGRKQESRQSPKAVLAASDAKEPGHDDTVYPRRSKSYAPTISAQQYPEPRNLDGRVMAETHITAGELSGGAASTSNALAQASRETSDDDDETGSLLDERR